MSDALQRALAVDQSYDFACGELTSRFEFAAGGVKTRVQVITFCSRDMPSLVCQDIVVDVDGTGPLGLKSIVDARHVDGRALRHFRDTPGETDPACDGAALWESAGGLSTCGIAYVTELIGNNGGAPERSSLVDRTLSTSYAFRARAGQHYRLRQMASVVPSVMHCQPDLEAVRQVALARKRGFDVVRAANRAKWADLWRGRIRLVGASKRWQAMADAAFFYLMSSTHVASPASTSIFGLATWHDYHYYYGHVMWTSRPSLFPSLASCSLTAAERSWIIDPESCQRSQQCPPAWTPGRSVPMESAPSTGQEAAPMHGSASWHEDHGSLDVARAFAFHADTTGDLEFLRTRAWPVLSEVAKWVASRVTKTRQGYAIRSAMGIAERETEVDNAAFTNMAAVSVLRSAIDAANRLGRIADPTWAKIAEKIVISNARAGHRFP